jgi:hypothetical protein
MDTLLYGDSSAMAASAATCLQDPYYGLAQKDSNVTMAYLYWDGSFYYRVNLTAPYVSVVSVSAALPQPPRLGNTGGGDYVDISLALVILALFGIFVLLLLQQVLGRNLRIIRPLYKFQRWFFDPLHHTYDDMDDDDESYGRGNEYTVGEDVIPLSMGGRKGGDPSKYRAYFTEAEEWLNGTHSPGGDMELVNRRQMSSPDLLEMRTMSGNNGSSHPNDDSFRSFQSAEGDEDGAGLDEMKSRLQAEIPIRLIRDPELVDLPDLKSKSKVAVPVSLTESSAQAASSKVSNSL